MKHRDILDFQGHEVRAFPDFPWQRIETWQYVLLDPNATNHEVLQALLHDQHYPYSFSSPYPEGRRLPPVRGPYLLESLTPYSFFPIAIEEAWSQLDQFLNDWDPPLTRVKLANRDAGWSSTLRQLTRSFNYERRIKTQRVFVAGERIGEFVVIDRDTKLILDVARAVD